MSQTYSNDNVFLDGGTLLGGSGARVVGACLYTDPSSNRYLYIANDDDGLSGYKFSDHTLYGVSEHSSAGVWLNYDTGRIVSIDCAPIQFGSYLVVACNGGKIASFDGASWKYPDGTGSGTGPYNSGSAVDDKKILRVVALGNTYLVVGAEEGRIASWNCSAWTNYDASSGLRSNGDMLGRRNITLMAAVGTTRLYVYEDSGRAFMWDTSTSVWTPVRMNLEAGDFEVQSIVSGCEAYPLFYGMETGEVSYLDESGLHHSDDSPLAAANAITTAASWEDILLFGGANGRLASFDMVNWKRADGTGTGIGIHNDGSAVGDDGIVAIVTSGNKVFLLTLQKRIATGDVAVGTWYEYDGGTASLSYSGRIVPAFLVGLFRSAPSGEWELCDGEFGTPDLDGVFLKGASSEGNPGGSDTHQHEAYSGYSGYSAAYGCSCSPPSGEECDSACFARHRHTVNHLHGSCDHKPPYIELLSAKRKNAVTIPTSFVGLFESLPDGWTQYSAANARLLRCSTSLAGGTGGTATHTHSLTGNTASAGGGAGSKYSSDDNRMSHTHSMAHLHAACANNPPFVQLIPAYPNASLSSLPSGIICYFLGNTVPYGWSLYTPGLGKFTKMDSSANLTGGGASTHSHAAESFNAGAASYTGGYTRSGSSNAAGSSCSELSHVHTTGHGHLDSQTLEPANCSLLICRKD